MTARRLATPEARWRLRPDRRLRTERDGTILMGGHPFRIMKLSSRGATLAKQWFAGTGPEPSTPAEFALAERIMSADMAHPEPVGGDRPFHVVIPFHGDVLELYRTLPTIADQRPASITVVDDGNTPPVPPISGVTVLRHDEPRGPAAARNRGWRHLVDHDDIDEAGVVVFVDAGVVTETGDLTTLAAHVCNAGAARSAGAAAPRVASTPGASIVHRYEELFSPLDLGPDPAIVGPGRRVTYVPTACLGVRLSALLELDGFDDTLRYGEDVDFVWRLSETQAVRYDPTVVVQHQPRQSIRALAEQRFRYASAAAELAERHPDASHPWITTWLGVAGVVAISCRRPLLGIGLGALQVPRLADRLEGTATPLPTAIRLSTIGHGWAVRSFAEATARSWIGLSFVCALLPTPLSGAARCWIALGWARRLLATTDPALVALGIVDDVAYGAGVINGARKRRSWRALVPKMSGAGL